MKKTISVTLNSVIFTLEEDAYNKLREYLDSIKDHFSKAESSGGSDEIITDIEASIAEKFGAKLNDKKQVINLKDVENLIKVMGSVEDITSEDDVAQTTHPTTNPILNLHSKTQSLSFSFCQISLF
ncbi:hypothetical protein ACFLZ9_01825 [Patescibacteria group bacterium]